MKKLTPNELSRIALFFETLATVDLRIQQQKNLGLSLVSALRKLISCRLSCNP